MSLFRELNNCLCCLFKTEILLDLEYQPLANNFHELNEKEENFPLKMLFCLKCFHCQLSHAIDPSILFKNYKYVSGTSKTGMRFFKDNSEFIHNYKSINNGLERPEVEDDGERGNSVGDSRRRLILDIAFNDGSQLDFFKQLGWTTYGIDPATNLYELTTNKGHNIICDFWNIENAKKMPVMDVILAQNVFAHTEKIDEFLQACKIIMNDTTSLFIQTSQKNMIVNNEFDTIYHEHISFFNTKSMNTLVSRNGLVLNRVLENDIHGCSYIFEIKTIKDDSIYNVDMYLTKEDDNGLYKIDTYKNFNINSKISLENLKNTINEYKNKDYKCIGFGAAAKGQTVICYGNIILDYIIDENPLKIGLYSPKMNIPIVDLKHFENDESNKFLVVVLAWNFSEEIIEKINKLNKKCEIVIIKKYFPLLEII